MLYTEPISLNLFINKIKASNLLIFDFNHSTRSHTHKAKNYSIWFLIRRMKRNEVKYEKKISILYGFCIHERRYWRLITRLWYHTGHKWRHLFYFFDIKQLHKIGFLFTCMYSTYKPRTCMIQQKVFNSRYCNFNWW